MWNHNRKCVQDIVKCDWQKHATASSIPDCLAFRRCEQTAAEAAISSFVPVIFLFRCIPPPACSRQPGSRRPRFAEERGQVRPIYLKQKYAWSKLSIASTRVLATLRCKHVRWILNTSWNARGIIVLFRINIGRRRMEHHDTALKWNETIARANAVNVSNVQIDVALTHKQSKFNIHLACNLKCCLIKERRGYGDKNFFR